jgi:hypothetical protein
MPPGVLMPPGVPCSVLARAPAVRGRLRRATPCLATPLFVLPFDLPFLPFGLPFSAARLPEETLLNQDRASCCHESSHSILIEQCFCHDATSRRAGRQVDRCGLAGGFSSSSPRPLAGAGRGRARGGSSSRLGRARRTGLACPTWRAGPCTSPCAHATRSHRFVRRGSFRACAIRSRLPTSPRSASFIFRSRAITSTSSWRPTLPSPSSGVCRGSRGAAPRPSTGPPDDEVACGAADITPERSAHRPRRETGSSTSC